MDRINYWPFYVATGGCVASSLVFAFAPVNRIPFLLLVISSVTASAVNVACQHKPTKRTSLL